ncbi:YlcI/YnfO family protein [Mycobacterium paraterrae]|uniref:YlcI/YnfO family protein n=1 Tax=Mycobacterium paraterrae TaxID=577492 RepID=UPI0025776D67|nr:YlcI/YnfO family protein [Mycobacterium paraterrae]
MVPSPGPATGTHDDAAPSAATRPPKTSLTNTGEADEPSHDPRRGIQLLRPSGKPRTAGTGRRRLTATVPVRFPPELLEQVRAAAAADDRSVSSWIRRAVEHELRDPA